MNVKSVSETNPNEAALDEVWGALALSDEETAAAVDPIDPVDSIDPIDPIDPVDSGDSMEGGEPAELGDLDSEAEPVADSAEPEALEASAASEPPQPEDDERREGTTLLGRYLHDMARLQTLRPREEFDRARELEDLELAAWRLIVGRPEATEPVLATCERVLGATVTGSERLRRLARTSPRSSIFNVAARDVAAGLRRLDLDKLALEASAALILGEGGFSVEQRQAVARAVELVRRAKNEFVKANLRLVFAVARRFRGARMSLGDLVQEGNIGLLKAVDRFDYHRGYRFSTYATWWIRHAMARSLADKSRTVRVPVHLSDVKQRMARTRTELAAKLGREPTTDELCAATGLTAKKVASLDLAFTGNAVSLDRPFGDEDDRTLLDVVRDPSSEDHAIDDQLIQSDDLAELRASLTHLTPMEADILRMRFGLDGSDERTLSDLGVKYRLSRERIRQIQERALGKLRKELRRHAAA